MRRLKFCLWVLSSIALFACQHQTIKTKASLTLLIDEPFISNSPISQGDSATWVSASPLLINNTNDTLVYAYWDGHESNFFQTDNNNIVVIDKTFLDYLHLPIRQDTICPHSSRSSGSIYLCFRKVPDTTFNFRVRMKLLKWKKSYQTITPDDPIIQQAPVLWSEVEVIKTDRKHRQYDKTPGEYKKRYEPWLDTLTHFDRVNYNLSIDAHRAKRKKDTTVSSWDNAAYGMYSKMFDLVWVPLKLSNNSDHTLTYMTWNCSWDEMYQTNYTDVLIMPRFCLGNYPITTTLKAHTSSFLEVPVLLNKKAPRHGNKFKIGMVLLRNDIMPFLAFAKTLPLFIRDPRYVIWSNEIEIPADYVSVTTR